MDSELVQRFPNEKIVCDERVLAKLYLNGDAILYKVSLIEGRNRDQSSLFNFSLLFTGWEV